jgi:uncharacterized protein
VKKGESYTFSDSDNGELELEIEGPVKQVFSEPSHIPNWRSYGLKLKGKDPSTPIFFFEWQRINYTYIVKARTGISPPLELRINEKTIKTSKEKDGFVFLSGSFSFNDAVGPTHIEIRNAINKQIFRLETEVFPQKMDYSSDFKAMMTEVSQIVSNLTYDILKETYQKAKPKSTGFTTENEWWNILDNLFESLVLNLGVIRRMAKHEIQSSEVVIPADRVRQASKHHIVWFGKNRKYIGKKEQGFKVGQNYYTHAPSKKKFVTYDTWENRFVAWGIQSLIIKLKSFKKSINRQLTPSQEANYSSFIRRINLYQSRLQSILHENPFSEVGRFEKRSHFSATLTRGTGYREFLFIYLILSRGLDLSENDIFKIDQKNVSTLYEYWCFLKLVQLFKEQRPNSIALQSLIKVKANKIKVELAKGEESKIAFVDHETKLQTIVYFNKEYQKDKKRIFTFNQRPDISVCFSKKEFANPFWYLFDAKYRFEEETNTLQAEKRFNVPQDAIGQLHRYRDAILHSEPISTSYRKAMKNLGGVILYPYPLLEGDFLNNVYYKSLKDINIGALPFLPGKTELVRRFITDLIAKSPEEHYEQVVEMNRIDYEQNREKWKEFVTIGVIPKVNQEKRLDFFIRTKLHHVPFVKSIHSKIYSSKYLLVCQSGTKNAFLCDVENWEVLSDNEIKKLGANWSLRGNKYLAFNVKNIRKIQTPTAVSPISFRYASRKGLEKYLIDGDKNYFFLTNPDAARLYKALMERGIKCNISWVDSQSDPSLIEFSIDSLKVKSSDCFPELHYLIDSKLLGLNELLELL